MHYCSSLTQIKERRPTSYTNTKIGFWHTPRSYAVLFSWKEDFFLPSDTGTLFQTDFVSIFFNMFRFFDMFTEHSKPLSTIIAWTYYKVLRILESIEILFQIP